MSHGKKMSKPSKIGNKKKSLTKSGATSAEYVIDSDSDIESVSEKAPTSNKPTLIDTHNAKLPHNLKRKAVDISGSPNGKSAAGSQDHRAATKQSLAEKVQSNGKSKRKSREVASESSDSSGSSLEETSTADRAVKATAQRSRSGTTESDPRSGLSDSSGSEEDDGEIDSDEDKGNESPEQSVHTAAAPVQVDASTASPNSRRLTAIPPFQPPEGFSSSLINHDSTTRVRNIFSKENLQGKEIWHFTVPASLRIEDIRSFTKSDMLDGKSVLTHQGVDYSFGIETGKGVISKVLIPARKDNKYQPVTSPIHQTLHLRQVTQIPDTNLGHVSTTTGTIAGARKPILKQPEGLKLVYLPFGNTESSMNEQTAIKQARRRIDNTKLPAFTEPSPAVKKAKKSKKSSGHDKPTEWMDPEAYSAPVVVGSASQHTIDFPSEDTSGVVPLDPDKEHMDYTKSDVSEEKAKRKAEKKARKEARKADREAEASRG